MVVVVKLWMIREMSYAYVLLISEYKKDW